MSKRPSRFRANLAEIRRYPSAIVGCVMIMMLVGVAIYALAVLSYDDAVRLWRGGAVWAENPRNARPVWYNLVPGVERPTTIVLDSTDPEAEVERTQVGEQRYEISIRLPFEYEYDGFPREVNLFVRSEFDDARPFLVSTWHTPDGRRIPLGRQQVRQTEILRLSQDRDIAGRLGGVSPRFGFFTPDDTPEAAEQGEYELEITATVFDHDAKVDARLVVYGQVHGIAGTDHRRRDIGVALLYGTPIALSFGLLAVVGAYITTFVISAVGTWFGRWVDTLIQRIAEVNMAIPLLVVLIMVGTLYSRSIWVMLAVTIALNVFSPGIKIFRAMFLQVKTAPYIEAAQTYGAGNTRIIFRYMIPKILPVLIPQFVLGIPTFVFLEATLALLGLGDPVLPTWGKVLQDAHQNGALYNGYYYWVLLPAGLLIVTGLGFALVGFALDRIFNPRLRNV